jgi:hypothetical protein
MPKPPGTPDEDEAERLAKNKFNKDKYDCMYERDSKKRLERRKDRREERRERAESEINYSYSSSGSGNGTIGRSEPYDSFWHKLAGFIKVLAYVFLIVALLAIPSSPVVQEGAGAINWKEGAGAIKVAASCIITILVIEYVY